MVVWLVEYCSSTIFAVDFFIFCVEYSFLIINFTCIHYTFNSEQQPLFLTCKREPTETRVCWSKI